MLSNPTLDPRRTTVRADLAMAHVQPPLHSHHGADPLPNLVTAVRVRLRWSSTDPYVITARFPRGVCWDISRDLLRDGLHAPTGIGDVSVLPDPYEPGYAELVLSSPSGRACLRFAAAELAAFLDRLPIEFTPTDTTDTDGALS